MLDHDELDHLLVFRPPSAPSETTEAEALLGTCPEPGLPEGSVRVYALVDIERRRPPWVVAAVEVFMAPGTRSWHVRRAGGAATHHLRLATELIRAATMTGATRITLARTASADAERLMRTCLGAVGARRGLSVEF